MSMLMFDWTCEDLTELHLHELDGPTPEVQLMAQRLCNHNEDHVVEAENMAAAARLATAADTAEVVTDDDHEFCHMITGFLHY